jgi:serine/threonine protein kinase
METPLCPQCRTPMPPHALAGLCPACLLEQGAFASQFNTADPAFVPPAIEELAPLFPTLEILELIGRGGMGAVYKARQTELDRVVALKILPSAIAHDPAFSKRFTREARALAKLNHPGIVALYEFGRTGDLFFFLMEFVDGVNLRQLLQGERLSAREALAIVPRICDALQYAHDSGIVHRDIKPENILLDRQGSVKIADFGLAKLVGPEPAFPPNESAVTGFTEVGKLMGTPAYMAPEQIDHPASVDHRADIYALGVIFYQMLTGKLPDQPLTPPSSRTLIDVRLDEVVIRALQQNPTMRFQQVSELKTRVEEISNSAPNEPATKRKPTLLQVTGVLLILCLPLSVALPILTRVQQRNQNLEETTFTAPGQESREAAAEIIKQALRPYPGVILSSQSYNTSTRFDDTTKLWRIGVKDVDVKRARERLDQAGAAVGDALNRGNTDPLRETIHFVESRSTSANMIIWSADQQFVSRLIWGVMAGILLSAIGLLCLRLPRASHAPPVSKMPGWISLGLLATGAWGVFTLLKSSYFMGQAALGVSILAGVPAMMVGLSARSGRLGIVVAALSWCGMLGLLVAFALPIYGHWSNSGWTDIEIPAAGGLAAPVPHEKPQHEEREEKLNAVTAWLESIDAGKYDEAWDRTSTLTRALETQAGWTDKLKHARDPLGPTVTRKNSRTKWTSRLEGAPDGLYYVFTFETDFATKSKVVETVTLIYQDDGNWRVLGYSIQ